MRVLFLRPQPGVKSLKYALAFKNVGAHIEPYHAYTTKTLTQLYGYGDEHFEKFIRLDPRRLGEGLKQIVREHSIELIHGMNAPDVLTRVAVENVDEIPIIHNNQDTVSLQQTPYTPESIFEKELVDERIANELCDARIHVSQALLEYIQAKYGPKRDIVFQNYVSKSLVPSSFMRRLSESDGNVHIVYEGTLSSFPGDHYDLRDIFKDLANHGYHVHIYDSHNNQDYYKLAKTHDLIRYHGHRDPRELPYEITQYDCGWAGFNVEKNKEHMDVALPNKLFEYLASGLPVLSFPHKAQKEFIESNEVGIVFEDLGELDHRIKERSTIRQLRENVMRKRSDFTMEANIGKVLSLYDSLLESSRTNSLKCLSP